MNTDLHLLPIGTQVVIRTAMHTPSDEVTRPAGSAGVVRQVPADLHHAYRIQFPDGREQTFLRRDLEVRKQHRMPELPEAPD